MKNKKSLILVVCAFALFGCGEGTSSAATSTNSGNTSSTQESNTKNSSAQDENVQKSITTSMFKEQLTKTTDALNAKNAIGISSSQEKLDLSFVDTSTTKEFDKDDNLLDDQTASESNSFELSCTGFTAKAALKGLKEDSVNKLSGSTSFSSKVNFKYTNYGETEPAINVQNQDMTAAFYLADNTVYGDLNDANLRGLISSLLDVAKAEDVTMDDIPNYAKQGDILSDEDITMPLNLFSIDGFEDTLNSFVETYDELPTAFKNALTFKKDNDYYYADITVTKVILGALPLAFQTYAKSKLDATDENYQDDCEKIDDATDIMNKVVAKMTLRNFNVQLAMNDNGFAFATADIDFSVNGYEADNDTEVHEDKSYTQTVNTIDSFSLAFKGQTDFVYDDAVTVDSHGDHEYEDLGVDVDEVVDDLKDQFGIDE